MRHIYYIQYKWDIKCVQIQTYICEQIIDTKKNIILLTARLIKQTKKLRYNFIKCKTFRGMKCVQMWS